MDETKLKILNYSKQVIINHGYKNFRVDDIAKDLGISKSTIYKIFRTKDAIVKEVVQYHFDLIKNEFIEILNDKENPNFVQKITKLINLKRQNIPFLSTKVIDDLKNQIPDIIEYIKEKNEESISLFFKLIDLGVEQGYVKEHINKKLIYFIHFFSIRNIMQYEVQSLIPLEAPDIIHQIHEILFGGILTRKGQDQIHNVINCEDKK